jgi:hypothetical protein
MTKRFTAPQLMRPFAWIAAGAFLLAANYCICEAFSSDAHEEASHQHAPAGHHDEQAPASHTQSDPCCATLQAVLPTLGHLQLPLASHSLLSDLTVQSVDVPGFADLSFAPTGLSPPAREPTATRPFYRTTYANHAPPVRLA